MYKSALDREGLALYNGRRAPKKQNPESFWLRGFEICVSYWPRTKFYMYHKTSDQQDIGWLDSFRFFSARSAGFSPLGISQPVGIYIPQSLRWKPVRLQTHIAPQWGQLVALADGFGAFEGFKLRLFTPAYDMAVFREPAA